MSKYRVTCDALGDKTEKAWVEITVEAESDFMVAKIVEGQAKQRNPALRNKNFVLRKVEKWARKKQPS